jgi:hypothetical protein
MRARHTTDVRLLSVVSDTRAVADESRRGVLRLGALGAVSALVPNCGSHGEGADTGPAGAGGGNAFVAGGGKAGANQGFPGIGGLGGGGAPVTTGVMTSEDTGADFVIPALPAPASLTPNPKLPDPFTSLSGSRVATLLQWRNRREELSKLAQAFIYGTKPPKPSGLTASFSAGKLALTCSDGGKSISFSVTITLPLTGTPPYPALIVLGSYALLPVAGGGVATIAFNNDEMAQQLDKTSRGKGKFFDLYGTSIDSGSLIAWAWGVSRVIDGLEQTAPLHGIDVTRLAVTGCSRNGKGALACGAFDERIALTIPQESGAGGAASWRIAEDELANGQKIQSASEIIGENAWLGTGFNQFAKSAATLPIDQHEIMALCAPRGLLVLENDIEWLGPVATYGASKAAHKVYEALGFPNNMGISLSTPHNHCQLPSDQALDLYAYLIAFLLAGSANTAVDESTRGIVLDEAKWIDWTVPVLA